MKALTLTQPWATLVAAGAKRIETRPWNTAYRGPLAIHAAKGFPRSAIEFCFEEPFASALRQAGITTPADLPVGAVIAECRFAASWRFDGAQRYVVGDKQFVDLTEPELSFGNFDPGRFGFLLLDVNRFGSPIPARGALGLWNWTRA